MPGWLIIVIGILLGLLSLLWDGLFIVDMFAFGIMMSLDWAQALCEGAGINTGDVYLALAIGFVITGILSQFGGGRIFGGSLIMVLFILVGLLAYPGPATFIATTVMPMLNNIVLRIAAVMSLPFLLLVIFIVL